MIRLGLTQRVDIVEEYGERRDCLDQSWTDLLEDWGYRPIPLPNTVADPTDYLDSMDLDGLALTGGNDIAYLDGATRAAPERDQLEQTALDWALRKNIPTIGICRGLEFINIHFNGTISIVDDHVATKHPITFSSSTIQLLQIFLPALPDKTQVNSYHNYGIRKQDVADGLKILATARDDTVEAVIHPEYPLIGIMWHPERGTPSTEVDRKLFDALFSLTNQ